MADLLEKRLKINSEIKSSSKTEDILYREKMNVIETINKYFNVNGRVDKTIELIANDFIKFILNVTDRGAVSNLFKGFLNSLEYEYKNGVRNYYQLHKIPSNFKYNFNYDCHYENFQKQLELAKNSYESTLSELIKKYEQELLKELDSLKECGFYLELQDEFYNLKSYYLDNFITKINIDEDLIFYVNSFKEQLKKIVNCFENSKLVKSLFLQVEFSNNEELINKVKSLQSKINSEEFFKEYMKIKNLIDNYMRKARIELLYSQVVSKYTQVINGLNVSDDYNTLNNVNIDFTNVVNILKLASYGFVDLDKIANSIYNLSFDGSSEDCDLTRDIFSEITMFNENKIFFTNKAGTFLPFSYIDFEDLKLTANKINYLEKRIEKDRISFDDLDDLIFLDDFYNKGIFVGRRGLTEDGFIYDVLYKFGDVYLITECDEFDFHLYRGKFKNFEDNENLIDFKDLSYFKGTIAKYLSKEIEMVTGEISILKF